MKVHKYVLPILAIVLLLGTVQVAKVLGYWSTTGKGEIVVDEAGQPDPTGIKGWMTLQDVVATYGIPQERLYADIGLPAEQDPATPLKELESVVPDFELELVREGVRVYYAETGLTIAADEDSAPQ